MKKEKIKKLHNVRDRSIVRQTQIHGKAVNDLPNDALLFWGKYLLNSIRESNGFPNKNNVASLYKLIENLYKDISYLNPEYKFGSLKRVEDALYAVKTPFFIEFQIIFTTIRIEVNSNSNVLDDLYIDRLKTIFDKLFSYRDKQVTEYKADSNAYKFLTDNPYYLSLNEFNSLISRINQFVIKDIFFKKENLKDISMMSNPMRYKYASIDDYNKLMKLMNHNIFTTEGEFNNIFYHLKNYTIF